MIIQIFLYLLQTYNSVSYIQYGTQRKSSSYFKKFIDFDEQKHIFYYNVYSNENKYVLKIPILKSERLSGEKEFKIEKFDLTRYTFLLNCEQNHS